jgi:uncharacterized membrane protein YhaH (DUF805 family)
MDVQAIAENYRDIIANHYFDMRGRVSRSQFWWFVLANAIASLLAQIVGDFVHLPLRELYGLAVLLPSMSLGARRLQDIGKNGQLVWIPLLLIAALQVAGILLALAWFMAGFLALLLTPGLIVGGIALLVFAVVLIVFWIKPGDPLPNAYGSVPPVFDPMKPAAI